MARPRALVIGGSVGGLFAAHLLRAAGFDVLVCERVAGDLGDRGAGIGTREELFAVMRRIGLPAETLHGVAVRGRIGLAADGGVIHGAPVPAVTSAWSRIWRPLRRALPDDCYAAGQKLTRLEQAGDQVTAEFADGMRDAADLLVAADGLHSTVRQQLLPEIEPRYAGYVAWRGVVRERNAAPAVRDLLFEHMLFGCPDGELMLSIPMPGTAEAADERCCHFVWFRTVDQDTLADLCTDAAGRRHGLSIPPPLIREELLAGLRRDAQALLAPQLASLVSATEQIILQPIFDLESPRMAFGRVALLGEAAFVARPHVASGVMKAAIDAETLANALAADRDVAAALQRYNAERQPYGTWLVARGRRIGEHVTAHGRDARARIEVLVHQYGSAGVVEREPIAARR